MPAAEMSAAEMSAAESETDLEAARFTSLPLPSMTSTIILPPRRAMAAKQVVLVATGHDDAAVVQRYLEESQQQLHNQTGKILLVLDEDATMDLQVRTLKVSRILDVGD